MEQQETGPAGHIKGNQPHSVRGVVEIKRLRQLLLWVWSGLVLSLGLWVYFQHGHSHTELNLMYARAFVDKDIAYRHWNAVHGGVYVPVDEVTQPNPYLKLPQRDVTTTSGLELTLVNPAYMTRQVHELSAHTYEILGHITSLKPIRPANAADPWETEALKAFGQGSKEFSGVSEINGKRYLRYMRPLYIEPPCLKCHAQQGYKLGDVRGGISVSIPYASIAALHRWHNLVLWVSNLLLWLLGLLGLFFAMHKLMKGMQLRDEMEQQLRMAKAEATQERDLARQYFDLAGVMMVALDLEGRVVRLNRKAGEVLGIDPAAAKGLDWFQTFLPEEARQETRQVFLQMTRGELAQAEFHENLVLTCAGEQRLISWRNTLITDENGTIVTTLAGGEDITQRSLQEVAQQREGKRLRSTLALGSFAGKEAKAILDYALEECVEITASRYALIGTVNGDQTAVTIHAWSREAMLDCAVAEPSIEFSLGEAGLWAEPVRSRKPIIINDYGGVHAGKKGAPAGHVEIRRYLAVPIIEGERVVSIAAVANKLAAYDETDQSNLTEFVANAWSLIQRNQAEAELTLLNRELEQRVEQRSRELQQSEAQTRVMLLSLAEGLIEVDADGHVVLMNPEAERLLRCPLLEAQGKPVSELIRLQQAEDSAQPLQEGFISRALRSGKVCRNESVWLRRADGSRFIASCIASPIVGEGRVKGVVATFQDITKHKQAEYLRNELVARVGHELRTPLAGMSGAVELLRFKQNLTADKQAKLLGILAEDTQRLIHMVEDFTELRSHLMGQIDYLAEPLELAPVLQAAIDRFAAPKGLHRFTLQVAEPLPRVNADAASLSRVMDKLLANAVKFSPDGGEIGVVARVSEDELWVSVSDQGIGMTAAMVAQLFTPLFQAEATDTRQFAGLGLGLAVVKAIIENQNGRVWAESEQGKGSTFYFSLPLVGAERR